MATRKKVIAALEAHEPRAKLLEFPGPCSFQAQLEAPEGHHWEHDVHCRACPEWLAGPRSEYWDLVLEEIAELPPAVPCVDDDCEGVAYFGACDFWAEGDL